MTEHKSFWSSTLRMYAREVLWGGINTFTTIAGVIWAVAAIVMSASAGSTASLQVCWRELSTGSGKLVGLTVLLFVLTFVLADIFAYAKLHRHVWHRPGSLVLTRTEDCVCVTTGSAGGLPVNVEYRIVLDMSNPGDEKVRLRSIELTSLEPRTGFFGVANRREEWSARQGNTSWQRLQFTDWHWFEANTWDVQLRCIVKSVAIQRVPTVGDARERVIRDMIRDVAALRRGHWTAELKYEYNTRDVKGETVSVRIEGSYAPFVQAFVRGMKKNAPKLLVESIDPEVLLEQLHSGGG